MLLVPERIHGLPETAVEVSRKLPLLGQGLEGLALPDGIVSGDYGEVTLMQGLSQAHSGLTIGSRYYLSTTPGALTTTAPVAVGNIEQFVGIALSDNLLYFNSGTWIQH